MEDERAKDVDPGELDTHRPWLLKLAVAMLRDPALAEDCVQDVFVAALRMGVPRPYADFSLRPWLKRVLVNRTRKLGDRAALRRHHERRAPAERPRERGGDPLEARELRAELRRALMTLDQRSRNVVLLRHKRDLPPAQIAAYLGVPVKTVNSWLYRAYGKLRERLDGRFDDLGGWAPLVLSTLRESEGEGIDPRAHGEAVYRRGHALGGSRRSLLLAGSAAGAVLLVGALGSWLALRGGARARPAAALLAAIGTSGGESAPVELSLRAEAGRAATAAGTPAADQEQAATNPVREAPTWSGRLVDPDGTPVPGLLLAFVPLAESDLRYFNDRANAGYDGRDELPAHGGGVDPSAMPSEFHSGADGAFSLPAPAVPGWIDVLDEEWSLVSSSVALELPPLTDALVQIAPARRVVGRVSRRDGVPLASVRVELRQPEHLLGNPFASRIAFEPSVLTGDDGVFLFTDAPDLTDALLRFDLDGYEPVELRFEQLAVPPDESVVTLEEEAPHRSITGRVVDSLGRPIDGAFLSLDWTSTATSDEEGRFRLKLPAGSADTAAQRAAIIRGVAPSFLPIQRKLERGTGAPLDVELVFDAPALTLEGVVLRADGNPHPNATVWLPSPMAVSLPPGHRPPVFAEHVMGGPQDGGSLEVTVTDAEGRFRLRGLQDRAYVLRVADPETREWFATEPLHPDQRYVLLEFPPDGLLAAVRGVVVGSDGAPITDAFVARSYPRLDARLPDGRRYATRSPGAKVAVDADGRFALHDVARRGGILTVLGSSIQTRHVELEREPNPSELRVVVGRLCRVVVEPTAEFERFSFAAERGDTLEFLAVSRGDSAVIADAPMLAERSDEYLVADLARELVLWSGAEEVGRTSITLVPGELNVLRP